MLSKLQTVILSSSLWLSYAAFGAPYNEVFDKNGKLRPAYKEYQQRQGVKIYPVKDATARAMMGSPLGDSIKILPIPLVLSDEDYKTLQLGALQRQRAIHAFFADVIFDNAKTIIKSGLVDEKVLEILFSIEPPHFSLEYLRFIWNQRTSNDVNYIIGSDIVRNARGQFVVLEDNIGNLGGIGDIASIHSVMDQHIQKNETIEYSAPLEKVIRQFLRDIPEQDWGTQVIAICDVNDPTSHSSRLKVEDQENMRKAAILKKMGIPIVSIDEFGKKDSQIKVHGFEGHNAVKKIINFYDLTASQLGQDKAFLLYMRFQSREVDFLTPPGTTLLGNKAFLPLVDNFIRIYLKEKPIIKTQPTEWVRGFLSDEVIQPGWVVKKTDGQQGSEVYIIDHMPETLRKNLQLKVQNWAAASMISTNLQRPHYIRQKLVDPSFIPSTADAKSAWIKFNVDFRPQIFVLGNESSTPAIWGRASFKFPGHLNNVSQGAFEVVVNSASGACEGKLLKVD